MNCIRRLVFIEQSVIALILLDVIAFLLQIVIPISLYKEKENPVENKRIISQYDDVSASFYRSLLIAVILLIRIILMITAETYRWRNLSRIKLINFNR